MRSILGIRITTYFAMFAAMLLFEWLAPYAKMGQKKSIRVLFHLGISIANSIALYFVMTPPLLAALQSTHLHRFGAAHFLGLNGGLEILTTVVAFDLWDYWMHLANHKIRFLWKFHQAHHSDMEIDVTTAARFHIGELIFSGISKYLMILLWGPSLWGLVTFDILLTLASQFHHSNLNIPFGIQDGMEKMIVTPRMHRCHHSLHPYCFNTNFSTVLSFWDRLFGSYHWARSSHKLEKVGLYKISGPETMKIVPFLKTPLLK